MKTETMLLLALLVAVGYFMWANNGAIRRALGMAPKEGMYSWSYINGKEGYEGANVDASMPAPVNGLSVHSRGGCQRDGGCLQPAPPRCGGSGGLR